MNEFTDGIYKYLIELQTNLNDNQDNRGKIQNLAFVMTLLCIKKALLL